MDDINTENFGLNLREAFEAVETHTGVAIFQELIARSFMTPEEFSAFCSQCYKKTQCWNNVMETLNLKYRFESKIRPL